jgi:uncharacterized protein (DUF736 family)
MTLTVHREKIRIRPCEKSSDREPDYRVVAETIFGTIEFGAAWKRTSERGQDFLSVSLDDPSLGGPLNAALFPDHSTGTAPLVWARPKAKPAAAAAAPAAEPARPASKKAKAA